MWYTPQPLRMLVLHRAGIEAPKEDTDKFKAHCEKYAVNLTNEEV